MTKRTRRRPNRADQVPAGDGFSPRQQEEINRAISIARRESGLDYVVYVGSANGDARGFAARVLGRLPDARRTVVVFVDPAAHALEIVTGENARRYVDDRACALAAAAMTSAFVAGDLAGGIANGVIMLGEQARRPPSLHLDTP